MRGLDAIERQVLAGSHAGCGYCQGVQLASDQEFEAAERLEARGLVQWEECSRQHFDDPDVGIQYTTRTPLGVLMLAVCSEVPV